MPVRRPMCLICLVILLLICAFTGADPPKPQWPVDELRERTISISGTVADRQIKNGSFQVFLKDVEFLKDHDRITADKTDFPDGSKGIIVKSSDIDTAKRYVKIGSRIEARGVFMPFEPQRCEGQFDMRTYYMVRGYEGSLIRARITGVSSGYGRIREMLRNIRDKAFDILRENMSEEDASLVAAMTLGDKTGLTQDTKELYQNAGISHVLALSGLHIASVGLAIMKMLKRAGMAGRTAGITAFSLISVYAVMTGMSTSTLRAMIMFGLFIVSGLFGRTYDLLSAAALSAILILIESPEYIYDSGFLLSFGAILGIACIYPVYINLPDAFKKDGEESPLKKSRLYSSVCISLSVMTATLPVMAASFMQISLCSVIINIVVVPLMGVVLFTGFGGIITGFLGADPGLILKITHYILRFYSFLGEASEKIDGNILIIGKPQKWQIITHAIIVISIVITGNFDIGAARRRRKIVDRSSRHFLINNSHHVKNKRNKITYIIENAKDLRKKRTGKMTIAFITTVMIPISFVIMLIHPRSDLEIRNVDVGQGDCALIWGEDIPAVMIDGGSSDIKQVGKYRITPVLKANRVTKIDYCFLSHMDSDHVNGVLEMLEDENSGIKIGTVVISEAVKMSDTDNENYIRLQNAAAAGKVRIMNISAGDRIRLGDLYFTCLNPAVYADENESSTVLCFEYEGFKGYFTGDIGEITERGMSDALQDVSYLKVAHHGSRNSSSDDFLQRAAPEISVISAGVDNSYGHPHKETLERLTDTGTKIYRTDTDGEVVIVFEGGKVSVRTMLGR